MKATIKIEKEVELRTLVVKAGVRYWEDSDVNGERDTENGENIPCKKGELWCPEIDIDSGFILNWKEGVTASVHYKVCDCLGFEVKDDTGTTVYEQEDGYVPDTLCPKESGHGDYIIMDIDEKGFIKNWSFEIDEFIVNED
jgi:hypothetical protein